MNPGRSHGAVSYAVGFPLAILLLALAVQEFPAALLLWALVAVWYVGGSIYLARLHLAGRLSMLVLAAWFFAPVVVCLARWLP